MPLTITLRHIFAAEARPISGENTLAPLKPSACSSAGSVSACGPPSSIGEPMRFGPIGDMMAAST